MSARSPFEEISLPALRGAVWNVHSKEHFSYREDIHLLEALAQVCGAIEWYGTRCLTLMDNMSCVLALCFWSDVLVPLGLPVTAGSIFAGSPRKVTPRTLHPVCTIVEKLGTKAQPFSIPEFQRQH